MTLIVALKCRDGVVIASDGQATCFSSGGPVRQRCRKIFELPGKVLLGASGTIGVIQRCRDTIRRYSDKLLRGLDGSIEERRGERVERVTLRDKIKRLVFFINKDERERHKAFHEKESGAPLADLLLVFYAENEERFRIWHIAPDGSDEFLDELGYGCSGIGDTFAYAFLKDLYSNDLDVETGKIVVYRVIKEAIEVGAFGLGEPIDIWIMKLEDDELSISEISEEEINALEDTYRAWKQSEKELFRRKILGESHDRSG